MSSAITCGDRFGDATEPPLPFLSLKSEIAGIFFTIVGVGVDTPLESTLLVLFDSNDDITRLGLLEFVAKPWSL